MRGKYRDQPPCKQTESGTALGQKLGASGKRPFQISPRCKECLRSVVTPRPRTTPLRIERWTKTPGDGGGHTHSDIGLLFTQFPGGRKVENRKVKRSERKVWFNLVFNCTRKKIGHSARLQVCCKSAVGKGFGVYHENNHGTNETAAGWTIGVGVLKAGTSVPRPELISSPCIASFVDGEAIQVSPSPALVERRPLGTGVDTHR